MDGSGFACLLLLLLCLGLGWVSLLRFGRVTGQETKERREEGKRGEGGGGDDGVIKGEGIREGRTRRTEHPLYGHKILREER